MTGRTTSQEKIRVPVALIRKVEHKITKGLRAAQKAYGVKFPRPKIEYNVDSTVAGWASFDDWTIWLNPTLLYYSPDKFIEEIPLHELGHLLADALETPRIKRQKQGDHGPHWQSVVETIGGVALPHHDFDVTMFMKSPFVYKCEECGMEYHFGTRRHHGAQRGTVYMCTSGCEPPLKYSHKLKKKKAKCFVDL